MGAGATSAGRRSAQALLRQRAAQQCEAPGPPLTLLPLRNEKARTWEAVRVTAHAWLQAHARPRSAQLASKTRHRRLQTLCTDAKSGRTAASRVTFYEGRLVSARGP